MMVGDVDYILNVIGGERGGLDGDDCDGSGGDDNVAKVTVEISS
jgi:hypothetical protein